MLKSEKRLRLSETALIVLMTLVGVSACSKTRSSIASTTPRESTTSPVTNVALTKPTTTNVSQSPTTGNPNQVPTSVTEVGEYGENIYDAAKANKWTQATAKLASLKNAAKRLDNESKIGENLNEDQLDGAIAALDKAVSAKGRLAAMRAANQVTLLAVNLSALFKSQVPIQVNLLDYYGRQLEIGVAAKDITLLKTTANNMSRTWNALRPAVKSHGGAAQAQTFDNLLAQVQVAKLSNEYGRLATAVLDQVDNLEQVFKQ